MGQYTNPTTLCVHGEVGAYVHASGWYAACSDCGATASPRRTTREALASFGREVGGTDMGVFRALYAERGRDA